MPVSPQTREWLEWVLTTSIPLVRLDNQGQIVERAAGTMLEYGERRFLLSVEHTVKRGTDGWAIALGQDDKGISVYRPNAFAYVAEFKRSTATLRHLDLCLAEIPKTLDSKYEHRTPRGLFDQRPHHIFLPEAQGSPSPEATYAFSGQVKPERHGATTFVSEMVVIPGLKYSHTQEEFHYFKLPVQHPGHAEFQGCSGAPIVDMQNAVVALVTGGDISSNLIAGIAIERCIPGIQFFIAQTSGA